MKKDTITIMGPRFDRNDGKTIHPPLETLEDFKALETFEPAFLKELGLQIWEETDTTIHWLYPAEWYQYIPEGLFIIDINGDTEVFMPNKTDNDRRFGALSFGFIQDKNGDNLH